MKRSRRRTKKDRDAEAIAALTQRIEDFYSGAHGQLVTSELINDGVVCVEPTVVGKAMIAVRSAFGCKPCTWAFSISTLDTWGVGPSEVAKMLFELGFRADKPAPDEFR